MDATESESKGQNHFLQFKGDKKPLARIVTRNLLLTLLTLGIYRFWARTNVRDYLWGNFTVLGEPFEYSGRGLELLLGFLVVMATIFFPWAMLTTAADIFDGYQFVGGFDNISYAVGLVAALVLASVGSYRARGFRLSRTSWRGVRASQRGSSAVYGIWLAGLTIAKFVSFGLITPKANAYLWRYRYDNTMFGDARFHVTDKSVRGLIIGFAVAYVFALPTLFLSLIWYKAHEYRTLVGRISFRDAKFQFDATGWDLLRLSSGNILIYGLTLGLGAPFAQRRRAQFVADHLSVIGSMNVDSVRQSLSDTPTLGEGLVDALGIGTV
jgi:uncharacterized membrane protein YjgN (DUF898 family)